MKYTRHTQFIKALGKRIREIRKEQGLSQQKLADLCDFELSQINRIELGIINTSVSHIATICEILNVPAKEVFDFEIEKPKSTKKQSPL